MSKEVDVTRIDTSPDNDSGALTVTHDTAGIITALVVIGGGVKVGFHPTVLNGVHTAPGKTHETTGIVTYAFHRTHDHEVLDGGSRDVVERSPALNGGIFPALLGGIGDVDGIVEYLKGE